MTSRPLGSSSDTTADQSVSGPRAFRQVDVFGSAPLGGNPVAVVHGAGGLDEATMAAFARWTNLSETTFLLSPTDAGADYRLRIFTPGGELPFAGHPTLGSAHAWLEAGGTPRSAGTLVQECGAGLVTLRLGGGSAPREAGPSEDASTDTSIRTGASPAPDAYAAIAFAAPPLMRSGPVDAETLAAAVAALGLREDDVVASSWVDNGPGWMGILVRDAALVRSLTPDFSAVGDLRLGVIGAYPEAEAHIEHEVTQAGDAHAARPEHAEGTSPASSTYDPVRPADYEVRAFVPGVGVPEDPVTGSLNAGLAQWLIGAGIAPRRYTASQGTQVGRTGIVGIEQVGEDIWVSGSTRTVFTGTADLG